MPRTKSAPRGRAVDDAVGMGGVFVNRAGEELQLSPRASWAGPDRYGERRGEGIDQETIVQQILGALARVELGQRALELFGGRIAGRVLNLGANLGHEAICLAGLGADEVVGTDHGDLFTGDLGHLQARTLGMLRNRIGELGFPARAADVPVRFLRDDITRTTLEAGRFDLIVSWQTLEHLIDLQRAFACMHALLAPGGMCFHEYHAFFGLDGGHSLCTIDIAWGHVRLDRDELAEYLVTRAPGRREAALDFYDRVLNRRTQRQVARAAEAAGFEVLLLLPRTRTDDLMLLTQDMLRQARRHEPQVEVVDLVSRMVRLVLRKPQRPAQGPAGRVR